MDQQPESIRTAEKSQVKTENLESSSEDASVIRLVNQILQEAVRQGATDIHIEPFREDMSLRYRVDGRLYDTPASPDLKYFYQAIISRIKIMAGLDIIERRLPQDGRARISVGDQELDLRVSVLPTLYGENVVIRMLPSSMILGMDRIGLSPAHLKIIEQLIQMPHGVIFVTGPTGSGKTTTLYACLNQLNSRDRKIVTIEDPVEYELKGITQIQVNPRINLTFARALRNMLRHDPNVMMVGEVRDRETAEITIQAALTGHLVFSTLHTNDAVGAVARLQDMGIESYLVASAVKAFVAQRLVRLICQNCKEPVPMEVMVSSTHLSATELQGRMGSSEKFFRGKGCNSCRQTGYHGRTAIYEMLLLNAPLQQKVIQKASAQEVQSLAFPKGRGMLLEDGWDKIRQGLTTLDEVLRVIQLEPRSE
ncbi:MAG: type II/IV secretion system protein, partial [Candidatus Omnitrophica bacterium]|nr:type II/IV secretion system protein [Candidatus Omnitrophota bacterium]